MEILHMGYQHRKGKEFTVSHKNGYQSGYVIQLFWSPMVFTINQQEYVMPDYSVILYHPDCPQIYRTTADAMVNDYIAFTADPKEMEGLVLNTPFHLSSPECLQKWFQLIYEEFCTVGPCYRETVDHLIRSLLSKYKESCLHRETDHSPLSPQNRFDSLRMQITSFPHWNWCVKDMAQQCMLSVSRFQYLYKQMFNVSPMTDVQNIRFMRAKHFLKYSKLSVADVAAQSGFHSDVHFMSQFKKKFGLSPTQYRQKARQKTENDDFSVKISAMEKDYTTQFTTRKNSIE